MESLLTKSFITLGLTLIIILSGILLRTVGKPYKAGIFTLHKLAVAAVVVFVVLIYIEHFKTIRFQGIGMFLFILSGLAFLISFISGALLSFENLSSFRMQIMHCVLSWLTILFIPIIWIVCH